LTKRLSFVHEQAKDEGMKSEREGPMLVALDALRGDPDAEKVKFLAEAWRADFARAKTLSWLDE
jgi:hypothetical protein